MKRKIWAVLLTCSMLLSGCSNHTAEQDRSFQTESDGITWEQAETTAFGKYPETVTYTLAKMSGLNNSNMPAGDTYEDNAYTRYLLEKINVQNDDVFEAYGSDNYDETLSMAIASKKLPDVIVVEDEQTLQTLVENDMIEDLTQVYTDCTSSRIKAIYDSYGEGILQDVTFDGRLMALPETNIDNGPSMLWLRKDWMDKLGLSAPETVSDMEHIIQTFVRQDPGGNGHGQTMGLACDYDMTGGCGYSSEYQTDIIFASYDAFPKQWIYDEDGHVVYGSVQPEAKQALGYLRQMYKNGTLDQSFLLRGNSNIIDTIVSGKCGAFFGPWWAPNNPLMSAMQADPDAEWMPYLLDTDADGNTQFASQKPTDKYIVVRKGYEHPEVVMKIISVLFDDMKYGDSGMEEMEQYYQLNVDPTARPLAINVDFKDALNRCYESLKSVLEGRKPMSRLSLLEGSYYNACRKHLNNTISSEEKDNWENWAAYSSRITACSTLNRGQVKQVESLYFGETETMNSKWWKLEEMERNAYLAIVTGEKPLSYFDEFVKEWCYNGGTAITSEVSREVADRATD